MKFTLPPSRKMLGQAFALAGSIFIFAGLVLNPVFLEKIFSGDDALNPDTQIKIFLFDLFCILCGAGCLIAREEFPSRIGAGLRRMFRGLAAHPRLASLIFGIFAAWLGIAAADHLLNRYLIHKSRTEPDPHLILKGYSEITMPDPDLGYKLKPDQQSVLYKEMRGKVIYKAVCNTDEMGRRVVPVEGRENAQDFIIFFADSFVFGEGVSDSETLPYYLAEGMPGRQPYSYAVRGYGPQHMLAKLDQAGMRQGIKPQTGLLIYVFIDPHVERAIGNMSTYLGMLKDSPYYDFDSKGNLIRKGSFSSGRPMISWFYKKLDSSGFVKYFKIQFPPLRERHFRLTAKIIERSRDVFAEKFQSRHFYVVFYPGVKKAEKIIPYLEKSGVAYFDYSDLWTEPENSKYVIGPDEVHPNPAAYRLVAQRLARDLAPVLRKKHPPLTPSP